MFSLLIWSLTNCLSICVAAGTLSTASTRTADNSRGPDREPGFFINERVPSLPLAVKSPYLSSWLPVGSGEVHLAGKWPQFWAGQTMGWTGFLRVDDKPYTFMGNPGSYGQEIAKQLFYKVNFSAFLNPNRGLNGLSAYFSSPLLRLSSALLPGAFISL